MTVKLVTLCGCSQMREVSNVVGPRLRLAIELERNAILPSSNWEDWTARCTIRDFEYTHSEHGVQIYREVYNEDSVPNEWKHRYTELFQAVYGMDEGL